LEAYASATAVVHRTREALEKGALLAPDRLRALALYQRAAAAGFQPATQALLRLQKDGAN